MNKLEKFMIDTLVYLLKDMPDIHDQVLNYFDISCISELSIEKYEAVTERLEGILELRDTDMGSQSRNLMKINLQSRKRNHT